MTKAMVRLDGKAQTAAMPRGMARICNAAIGSKTRFRVPKSLGRRTRVVLLEKGRKIKLPKTGVQQTVLV